MRFEGRVVEGLGIGGFEFGDLDCRARGDLQGLGFRILGCKGLGLGIQG